ncbi:MAG TPA: hypothetical protein VGG39_04110 [Polyangiaceae bacterium]|jgi:hypothetical protein
MGLGEGAQRRIAVVLADVLGEPLDVASSVAAFLDRYLRQVPFQAALGLRAVTWAVTWLPILFVGIPLPASMLSPATRLRYVARWAGARAYFVREGFYLLKAIALMGWGAHPAVRERLGLGPMAVHP